MLLTFVSYLTTSRCYVHIQICLVYIVNNDIVHTLYSSITLKAEIHSYILYITVPLHHMITQTIVALDSLGRFLEETEPIVEHLSYNDHSMESFMRLMKVFNKVMIPCMWCSPILLNELWKHFLLFTSINAFYFI